MELLKDPRNLQRAVSLLNQTQSARSVKMVKKAQSARDLLLDTAGVKPKDFKSAWKTGIAALVKGVDDHKEDQRNTRARGTDALRGVGFTVLSAAGEYLAPTTIRRNYTESRPEMMEIIVYKMKETYFPHTINVATWDAALNLEVAKCCGLVDCGTARSESGLEYRFAVFRGVGQIKWTGGIPRGGIPDVGCSGNFSLGNTSSIWFGNTDGSPHYVVSDLNELMA